MGHKGIGTWKRPYVAMRQMISGLGRSLTGRQSFYKRSVQYGRTYLTPSSREIHGVGAYKSVHKLFIFAAATNLRI